jgi:hypothetical protein
LDRLNDLISFEQPLCNPLYNPQLPSTSQGSRLLPRVSSHTRDNRLDSSSLLAPSKPSRHLSPATFITPDDQVSNLVLSKIPPAENLERGYMYGAVSTEVGDHSGIRGVPFFCHFHAAPRSGQPAGQPLASMPAVSVVAEVNGSSGWAPRCNDDKDSVPCGACTEPLEPLSFCAVEFDISTVHYAAPQSGLNRKRCRSAVE